MGGDLGRKVVNSSLTETESMEKFRPTLSGRKIGKPVINFK
jgi:hypothetical protein